MSFFKNMLYKLKNDLKTKLSSKSPVQQLGRWKLDYCDKKIGNKVNLTNEDHCGPCGSYTLNREKDEKYIINNNSNNKKFVKDKDNSKSNKYNINMVKSNIHNLDH